MAAVTAAVDESSRTAEGTYLSQQAERHTGAGDTLEGESEPYYWEEGGNPRVDWWEKVRHHLRFGGSMAMSGAEAVGEVVASTMGLTESKFQYVIDALETETFMREREEREEEERRKVEAERQEKMRQENGGVIDFQPKYSNPEATDDGIELGEGSSMHLSEKSSPKPKPGVIVDVPLA